MNPFTTCSLGTLFVRLNVSRIIVGVTPITISMILASSSMPNAINRIGSTESAMILSKNKMNRRKNWPNTGNIPICSPSTTAGISSSMLHANRFALATVSVQSMLVRNFFGSDAFSNPSGAASSVSGFRKASVTP